MGGCDSFHSGGVVLTGWALPPTTAQRGLLSVCRVAVLLDSGGQTRESPGVTIPLPTGPVGQEARPFVEPKAGK